MKKVRYLRHHYTQKIELAQKTTYAVDSYGIFSHRKFHRFRAPLRPNRSPRRPSPYTPCFKGAGLLYAQDSIFLKIKDFATVLGLTDSVCKLLLAVGRDNEKEYPPYGKYSGLAQRLAEFGQGADDQPEPPAASC